MTSSAMVSIMWENFIGVRSDCSARIWRPFIFALLLFGTLYAARCLTSDNVMRNGNTSVTKSFAAREEERLRGVIYRAHHIYAKRAESLVTAGGMTNMNKRLFGTPAAETPKPAEVKTPDAAAIETSELRPEITVKGVMIAGKNSAAIVSIPGEDTDRVVRPGDGFIYMGSGADITRVSESGLTVRWNGKVWDIPLD